MDARASLNYWIGQPPAFPVVVSAPSGAGKTSLCRTLAGRRPGTRYSVSSTSRTPSDVEKDGEDYHFISREGFETGIREGRFVEWTEYRHSYYGTPRKFLDGSLAEGHIVLLDLDVVGARKMKETYPDCVTVFVLVPSFEELEKRIRGRARDSQEEIEGRLENAAREMESVSEYDYVFVNDQFEKSVETLRAIIDTERYRVKRKIEGETE